jgi:hypothetical protein
MTDPVTAWDAVLLTANEVPVAPAPPVTGTGRATGQFALNARGDTLIYTITITSPTGAAVTQSHIHTGAIGANGGISVWLCGSATNPGPAGTPLCAAGTANGVLITGRVAVAATVVSSMQGFGTYANVHTTAYGSGEIRGQLRNIAP